MDKGVAPDLQTIGKGLGGGYAPVAGVLISHKVVDVLGKGTGALLTASLTKDILFPVLRRRKSSGSFRKTRSWRE